MESLPEIPKDGNIITIENDITNFYRYKDRIWKWYDIEGNYSNFSSQTNQNIYQPTAQPQPTENLYNPDHTLSLQYPR